MKTGLPITLTCDLSPRNQGIRIDVAKNGTAMTWPIPKGTKGEVISSNDNEVLVSLTWNIRGLMDMHSYETSYIWVKVHMMGSLFNY